DDPERLVLIAPSDHIVRDVMAFANAVSQGAAAARLDEIVVFGVPPTRVETGYGYIDVGDAMPTGPAPYAGFREKPDRATTEQMVASGRFLWNAGVFLAKARRLQQAFRLLAPDIFGAVEGAVDNLAADLVFQRLGAGYGDAPAEAFDTAIMEHVPGTVVPLDAGWSDVGSWHGVWSEARHDATGCATIGAVNAIGCEDAFLFSDDPNVRVTGLGLKNIAAVATRDAVLVVDLGDTQAVSDAVARLQIDGAPQAEVFLRDDRPWGHFETLAKGPRFQVKSIVVRPGAKLSLQSHEHRSEHWVVVEGTATVTVGAKTTLVTENQSVYIPVGSRHRLANDGRLPLRLIEVQTGPYLEEDDIVRYDDVYQRS
ncbi:MAG: mannose-1-phosphate guanylyltransferase/mannose-6-phosphate isomerase, partial [Pseudomonadota bacterium]